VFLLAQQGQLAREDNLRQRLIHALHVPALRPLSENAMVAR
jgi:hypothetical protein